MIDLTPEQARQAVCDLAARAKWRREHLPVLHEEPTCFCCGADLLTFHADGSYSDARPALRITAFGPNDVMLFRGHVCVECHQSGALTAERISKARGVTEQT